jgi:hypothetical protein
MQVWVLTDGRGNPYVPGKAIAVFTLEVQALGRRDKIIAESGGFPDDFEIFEFTLDE